MCVCVCVCVYTHWASQVEPLVKNSLANAGDPRDAGSIPESGRSPAGGHGNPVQYSYLENPMDRGAWRATVHRIEKSNTRQKKISSVQLLSHVRLFAAPWTAAQQASVSITNSQSLLKLMSIEFTQTHVH